MPKHRMRAKGLAKL